MKLKDFIEEVKKIKIKHALNVYDNQGNLLQYWIYEKMLDSEIVKKEIKSTKIINPITDKLENVKIAKCWLQ